MLNVTESPLFPPKSSSISWVELQRPVSNSLVRDGDATLGEQVFYVVKTEREPMVQPDGVTDDFRRKTVASLE